MEQRATLTWKIVAQVLVAHATDGRVEVELFDRFVEDQRTKDIKMYIATVDGSVHLSSAQRKASSEALSTRDIQTFIITDSRVVRGIVTVAGWLGAPANAYSWADINAPLEMIEETLGLSEEDRQSVVEAIEELSGRRVTEKVKAS